MPTLLSAGLAPPVLTAAAVPALQRLRKRLKARALPGLQTWEETPFRHPSALEVGSGPLVQKQRSPFLLR